MALGKIEVGVYIFFLMCGAPNGSLCGISNECASSKLKIAEANEYVYKRGSPARGKDQTKLMDLWSCKEGRCCE